MSNQNSNADGTNTIPRTTISQSGAITKQEVTLRDMRKDAMNLSNDPQASLLVTRDAAVRITERAITSALGTWTNLIAEKQSASTSSSEKNNSKDAVSKKSIETATLPKVSNGNDESNAENPNSQGSSVKSAPRSAGVTGPSETGDAGPIHGKSQPHFKSTRKTSSSKKHSQSPYSRSPKSVQKDKERSPSRQPPHKKKKTTKDEGKVTKSKKP